IGDALVLLPDARLAFAGDVAFHYVTPLAFEGHVGGWVEVCDRVGQMEIDTIVPGHGPVGSKENVRELRGYLDTIRRQAREAFDAGRTEQEAAGGIDLGEYASWVDADRLPLNVVRLYQEFRGEI
ncbi:MAG: MBL fold metallo-hydrolase, partial [Dehalococcoidia bacterium]